MNVENFNVFSMTCAVLVAGTAAAFITVRVRKAVVRVMLVAEARRSFERGESKPS